ncbi:DUF4350 domain-containing protein [Altererythrobacter lutimaris]|uniref:DUF4350 domain-containing protein n=1 Tax=Altererythrobacter lutimaris TaxID=2743979 RepID=A0A850HF77_9SPHN|nr:DUF4350 domain-containing protein [Altererythrobacter lutimaris]NVE95836.1 DUF4350 domain-containing protein [Altererythrobacter lutimaris]
MSAATAAPVQASHRASPFSKRTVLALVIASFLAFIAFLALIGAGQTSRQSNDGGSHASANGLNGYAGLVELLRLEGRDVTVSRTPSGMETFGLLVLTPPMNADAEDIQAILEDRYYTGPTLIILPKWYAQQVQDNPADDIEVEDGWVRLLFTANPEWMEELDKPYWFSVQQPWEGILESEDETFDAEEGDQPAVEELVAASEERRRIIENLEPTNWSGLGLSGKLPEGRYNSAPDTPGHMPLVTTQDGDILVSSVLGEEDSDFFVDAYPVTIVIEPDLMNNYGLSDRTRAAAALAIIDEVAYDEFDEIVFDVTLNGLGGSENLLTLAFRPPFLAATLCLILALLIIGWRAFIRFGPPLAEAQAMAFGKRRLVSNGAGLILRARRLNLLAEPYISLTTRRIGRRLGISRGDLGVISEALQERFPDEEPLLNRANTLRNARKPKDILRAAGALKELERKLER